METSKNALSAATFNSTRVIKSVIRSKSGPSGVGRLADRLLLSNSDAAEAFEKSAARLFCIDRSMPYLYTLPHVTENLIACFTASVPWWLVQLAGEFCAPLINHTRNNSSRVNQSSLQAAPAVPFRRR
jgi:hypothetical protein